MRGREHRVAGVVSSAQKHQGESCEVLLAFPHGWSANITSKFSHRRKERHQGSLRNPTQELSASQWVLWSERKRSSSFICNWQHPHAQQYWSSARTERERVDTVWAISTSTVNRMALPWLTIGSNPTCLGPAVTFVKVIKTLQCILLLVLSGNRSYCQS